MTASTENTRDLAARVAQLENRLAEWEDRAAITDVLYRYARAADRCDLDLLKSCYHPDATDCHWFFNGNAHDFADYVIPVLQQAANSQHSITNPIITLDGTRAFVESQWYVLHHLPLPDGRYLDQQLEGRYLDIFEKRDGVWKILHRQCATEAWREFVTEDHLAGVPADHPSRGQRAPYDPVNQGSTSSTRRSPPSRCPTSGSPRSLATRRNGNHTRREVHSGQPVIEPLGESELFEAAVDTVRIAVQPGLAALPRTGSQRRQ